jgi:hypothetical protein
LSLDILRAQGIAPPPAIDPSAAIVPVVQDHSRSSLGGSKKGTKRKIPSPAKSEDEKPYEEDNDDSEEIKALAVRS